jgi:hypothetical protein
MVLTEKTPLKLPEMVQFKLSFKTVHLLQGMEPELLDYYNLEITSLI